MVQKDPEGRYVFIQAWIDCLPYVILSIYLPPPAALSILYDAASFASKFPSSRIICMGDFNLIHDMSMDRFNLPHTSISSTSKSQLYVFLEEMGWIDLWRFSHPNSLEYTCHTPGRNSLSRIDYICGNALTCSSLIHISHKTRVASDHSPILAEFHIDATIYSKGIRKIHPFWLTILKTPDRIPGHLHSFKLANIVYEGSSSYWDSFKAYLRGCLQSAIIHVKKVTKREENDLAMKVTTLEATYVAEPSNTNRLQWLQAGAQYLNFQQEKSKRHLFFMNQRYFEFGNQSSSLLAHLIHQNNASPAILKIRASDGSICTLTNDILARFSDFYKSLYTSTLRYTDSQIDEYLDEIQFPMLSPDQQSLLEQDITMEELTDALKEMAKGKASGPDGIPIEVYCKYQDDILPPLLQVFRSSHANGFLPDSLSEANIILILKPDKDPLDCGSYRPISLLNVDYKLLTKILAMRLNKFISSIIHPDQAGFIPGRSTSDNLRRVQVISQLGAKLNKDWALASLDAAKAFDSIEWPFLLKVLAKFNFGPRFLKWIEIIYHNPKANIVLNGRSSAYFSLSRGTRQGCPLSPLLFALALEPLTIRLRSDASLSGIDSTDGEDRLAAYADDLILFLSNPDASLDRAISLIDIFGGYSGLQINWTKSFLCFLSSERAHLVGTSLSNLKVVSNFKYLGVQISRDTENMLDLNVWPLVGLCRDKFKLWSGLPLSVAGRINLIKMVIQPKCLYIMQHVFVIIPKTFFRTLESLLATFIWGPSRHKLKLAYLQRPKSEAGMALPDLHLYYLAGQLKYLSPWLAPLPPARPERHLAQYSRVSVLWPLLENASVSGVPLLPIQRVARQVWKEARKIVGFQDIPDDTPLWHNSTVEQLQLLGGAPFWEALGILTLKQLYSCNALQSFSQLREHFDIPHRDFYKYLQLRHALEAQWDANRLPISSYPLIGIIRSRGPGGLISTIYSYLITEKVIQNPLPVVDRWRSVIPDLTPEIVSDILESHTLVSPAINNRLIQLFIIHQCYLTPSRMYRMGRRGDSCCPRCGHSPANFWHMMWDCSVLQDFWHEVVSLLTEVIEQDVPCNPIVCLFGILDEEQWSHYNRIMLRETLFMARKTIALRWIDRRPPRLHTWKALVNKAIPYEKLVYVHRRCASKFYKIWDPWCQSTLTLCPSADMGTEEE